MTYYKLNPNHTLLKPHNMYLVFTDKIKSYEPYISKSLSQHLNCVKEKIDNYQSEWDSVKKYVNPYEYIHTIIPKQRYSVSKYKPLSRSFFKMIEICKTFNILDSYNETPLKSFHVAEGPGGFIEALLTLRKNNKDCYHGMTLIDTKEDVPGWKKGKDFFSKYPNVTLHSGPSNDGNLFSIDNFTYCFEKYSNSMDIITGDGGFDFSIDFNNQEMMSLKLTLAQVLYALTMQKEKGTFILKVFDCYSSAMIDIIYMLSCFYKDVFICKPNTSRYANSEKYIICKDFKYISTHFFNKTFSTMINNINNDKYLERIINLEISYYFYNRLEEINTIFGQQQLQFILNTIDMIKKKDKYDKLETTKKKNIQKSIDWCIKHNLEYNTIDTHNNIFLKTPTSETI